MLSHATAMPQPIKRLDKLRKVKYGTSDMVVTELCCGSMTWGSFNTEESKAHAQLDCFVKHGVNFIDTAEMYPVAFNYGKTTEAWIGNWLQKRVAAGAVKREDLYFATKCNPSGAPLRPWTLGATSLLLDGVEGDARLTFYHTQGSAAPWASRRTGRGTLLILNG